MTQATAAVPAPYVRSRLSVMMFLQYATWGAWLPILYAYLSGHLKFTGEQIGYCFSAGAIGAIFGPFIAGQLADRTFATQKLLGVSHLVGAGLVYAMGVTSDFNAFLALSAVYGFVYAPTMALTNSLAFAHLPNRDQDFGPVRVWGTVGWIAVGITVGQVLFRYHTPAGVGADEVTAAQNAGRAVAFQVSAAIGAVMGLYCFTLPDTPPSRNAKQNTAWLEALGEVFRMPLVVLFLVAVPVSIIHQFYFVQADGFIGSVQAKVTEKTWFDNAISQVFGVGGGLMTIGQMTEILVLFAMPFLTKVLSRKQLLLVGLLAYAARMALWAFMPTLPFVIAGIALHGLCFGCFIFVAFMIVDENTTSDVRATAQNLFNLVIVGIGTIVGSIFAANIVGGWASQGGSMDYQKLFSVPMWMALGCFGLTLLAYPSKKSAPG
ncbi:MAG: MFS transporter [Planctomycetota bacterium]